MPRRLPPETRCLQPLSTSCARTQCEWPWDTAEDIEKCTLPIDDPFVLRSMGLESAELQAMSAHTAAALQLAAGSPTSSPALQPSRAEAPIGSPALLSLPPPGQLPTNGGSLESLGVGQLGLTLAS